MRFAAFDGAGGIMLRFGGRAFAQEVAGGSYGLSPKKMLAASPGLSPLKMAVVGAIAPLEPE